MRARTGLGRGHLAPAAGHVAERRDHQLLRTNDPFAFGGVEGERAGGGLKRTSGSTERVLLQHVLLVEVEGAGVRESSAGKVDKEGALHSLHRDWKILKRRRTRNQVDIFSKDVILIPVNHNNAHWTAAAINFRRKRIESYDSMGMERGQVFKVKLKPFPPFPWQRC